MSVQPRPQNFIPSSYPQPIPALGQSINMGRPYGSMVYTGQPSAQPGGIDPSNLYGGTGTSPVHPYGQSFVHPLSGHSALVPPGLAQTSMIPPGALYGQPYPTGTMGNYPYPISTQQLQ